MANLPPSADWQALLDLALAEDIGPGDLTSTLVIDAGREGQARIEARAKMIVCGLPIIREVFSRVDPTYRKVFPRSIRLRTIVTITVNQIPNTSETI